MAVLEIVNYCNPILRKKCKPVKDPLSINSIIDEWEVTEGWWTHQPISRRYFKVNFNDGKNLIIFKDLLNNLWYKQIFA